MGVSPSLPSPHTHNHTHTTREIPFSIFWKVSSQKLNFKFLGKSLKLKLYSHEHLGRLTGNQRQMEVVDKFVGGLGLRAQPRRSLLGMGGCVGAHPQGPCFDRADLGAVGSRTSRGRLFGAIVWKNQSRGSCWLSQSTNLGRVEGWRALLPRPVSSERGEWQHGWQYHASSSLEYHFRALVCLRGSVGRTRVPRGRGDCEMQHKAQGHECSRPRLRRASIEGAPYEAL